MPIITEPTLLATTERGSLVVLDGLVYPLTPCCDASAKGCDGYVGCRGCYEEVSPAFGDCAIVGSHTFLSDLTRLCQVIGANIDTVRDALR